MKRFIAGFLLMALPSFGQVAMMALDDIPGTTEVCVTNWGPFIVTGLSDKATTQFVNQAVAPLSARLDAVDTALDGGTNNWNTAYGWGNHAGLYRVIGWVPSWGDLTDIPQDFPPSSHEHDYTAITNAPWLTEYTETDPIWAGVSNTVTAGAALGATAVQTESDPVATPLLSAHINDLANPHGVTAAQLGALTDIPPLDAVLAAGNIASHGLSITNEYGSVIFDINSDASGDTKISGLFTSVYGLEIENYGRYDQEGWISFRENDWPTYYWPWSLSWEEADDSCRIALVSQIPTDTATMAALAGYQSAAYWPPNATARDFFTFTTNANEITITGYNIDGGADVIIPDYINGWPVTEIGTEAFGGSGVTSIGGAGNVVTVEDYAFYSCTSLTSVSLPQLQTVGESAFGSCTLLASVSLPQAQTIGDGAFYSCTSLAFVSLPQVQTVEDYAFYSCTSLTSVSLPQVQTVGVGAFASCTSLASISLPQAQTVGDGAFVDCTSLASVYFDNDAPAIGEGIFADIPPNQVTNYVTNPQATGWGAKLGDMPVVRLPLYADAITLNGDTITEWPVGGGETSIIAPLCDSGTNVTVTSTQSVYSVAVTGAGPVGIDWSGLALDGTGRAEVTLRLNVTEWAGTNVTFSPALTFDRTPEILVTGVWEFAASTIDGVTTRIRQTWPECCGWQMADYGTASGAGAAASYGGGALPSIGTASNNTIKFRIPHELVFVRATIYPNNNSPTADQVTINLAATVSINNSTVTYNHSRSFQQYTYYYPRYEFWCVSWVGSSRANDGPRITYKRLYSDQDVGGLYPQFFVETRRLDANERAAYAAGWRP